jgi:hypothetical protein
LLDVHNDSKPINQVYILAKRLNQFTDNEKVTLTALPSERVITLLGGLHPKLYVAYKYSV